MKAILKFDLDDLDERRAFQLAARASDYQMFIWDFSQEVLRKYSKYGIPDEIKDADALLEKIIDEFYELRKQYKIEEPV